MLQNTLVDSWVSWWMTVSLADRSSPRASDAAAGSVSAPSRLKDSSRDVMRRMRVLI